MEMVNISGMLSSGKLVGTTAIITLIQNNVVYDCYINSVRTPELFEKIKGMHYGTELSFSATKTKCQYQSDMYKYIVQGEV